MATSGTYNFGPSLGDLVIQSFALCEIPRGEISTQHLADAQFAANLLFSEWSNFQPNLWLIDLQTITLIPGQATYSVPPETINLLTDAVYVTLNAGQPFSTDRVLTSISRNEYTGYPNKTQQGPPSQFWFDRLLAPTITLYPVPDAAIPYTLNYYRTRRPQDAVLAMNDTLEIPYRFLSAFVSGLGAKLAITYAPAKAEPLEAKAKTLYDQAIVQDIEDTPIYISPQLGGYYR